MGDWLANSLIQKILDWFAGIVVGVLNVLWDLLSATVFQSPDVTAMPQIKEFAGTSLGVVNTVYVLAILAMAIMIMGRDTIQSRYGPSELVPRLIIGLIAANFALPLCSAIIGLANAFTTALTSQPITAPGSVAHLRTTTTSALTPGGPGAPPVANTPSGFLLILIGLLIAMLAAILVIQYIVRIGVLIVVVGIAPIALALHGLPQTEGVAKLWWRSFLGTLGTAVIQAVGLHLTLKIFLSPDANYTVIGFPAQPSATFNLFVVLCMLIGVIKVPGLMRRYVTRGSGGNAGQIVKVLAIQAITRTVTSGFGGRSARVPAPRPRPGGSTGGRVGPTWPAHSPGGGSRPFPRTTPSPAPRMLSGTTPLPPPSGAAPGRVGVAYPSGRPVRPYTPDQLAQGVDVYTRALKARKTPGS